MEESVALRIFKEARAVLTEDHFVYTSGRHGRVYVNKDAIYPHTTLISTLCLGLAEEFVESEVDTVVGPAVGGVILSQWTAYHLTNLTGKQVYAVYAERVDGHLVIKRGYPAFVTGRRVLVVEDILNTGTSGRETVEAVRRIGGDVVGFGALYNRGTVTAAEVGNPPTFLSLVNLAAESWDADECPLCQTGIAVNTELGHGMQFLAQKTS